MISIRVLLLLVLVSCAYGHKKVKRDKKQHDNNVGIIGGHKISIEEVPFIVSLRLNGTYHWCGGSIIHERFILTAAHCIVPNREFKVVVGTDKINKGGKLYDVEKIIIHELYSNVTSDYDVCILKLNESLSFGPTVKKVLLTGNVIKLKKGTQLNTTGWGYMHPNGHYINTLKQTTVRYIKKRKDCQKFYGKHKRITRQMLCAGGNGKDSCKADGHIANELQQATVPYVMKRHCQLFYGKQARITRRMICAGGKGRDSCMGDSGGPLTWNNVQIGITSFGSGCGIVPGVYTKISAVKPWIEENIEKHHKKGEKRGRKKVQKSQKTKKLLKRALLKTF